MTPVIYKWKLDFPTAWNGKRYDNNIPLRSIRRQTIELPKGARPVGLYVANDPDGQEQVYLYTESDDKETGWEDRHFIIQATGQPYTGPGVASYIGMVVRFGGKEIGHVFEVSEADRSFT